MEFKVIHIDETELHGGMTSEMFRKISVIFRVIPMQI